jgi:arginine decarboxylase
MLREIKINAPLYEALVQHYHKNPRSFHVPGHRFGGGLQPPWNDYYRDILKLDVTELADTDNLHQAEGVIQEAQQLAADCFKADETYFLVGGSTSGNVAMILAVCNPGDMIIVQRNVHKSVLNGIILAGARAVFLTPQEDEKSGLSTVPSLQDVEDALERHPEVKAVFMSTPNYYGMAVDVASYAELAHRYECALLVDEAHGAHFGFHPAFPASALHAGADAVVQSTHKTLTAMTMGAMLHVKGDRLRKDALRQALAMVQSSSPSYPLMASIDIARAMVDTYGEQLFDGGLNAAEHFKNVMDQKAPAFRYLGEQAADSSLPWRLDPLRAVVWDGTGTLSGYELLKELERQGCWAEMADSKRVVLLFGISASYEDVEALAAVFAEIGKQHGLDTKNQINETRLSVFDQYRYDRISAPVILSRVIPDERSIETVPLYLAANRQSAELVIPYPPGIPVLYQGELITDGIIAVLTNLAEHGAVCQGIADSSLTSLRVYKKG